MIMLMNNAGDILVKIDKDKQKDAMIAFEKAYKQAMPTAAFQYDFVDDLVAREYRQEQRWQTIIGIAAGLSILICSLGMFGMAHLSTRQRMKEIGIRKVLGASVGAIVSLLSKDFIGLVFLGLAVASPIALWATNRWLQNFAYRIELQWWMFVVAGFAAAGIALLTVSFHSIKAAMANPVNSLKSE
jgi:putative ABC transport system permease protein